MDFKQLETVLVITSFEPVDIKGVIEEEYIETPLELEEEATPEP